MRALTNLDRAVMALSDSLTDPDVLLFAEDIELAIQAVERVRTKVILRERNQQKGDGQ